MRHAPDFRTALRGGRAGRPTVVAALAAHDAGAAPPIVGFIVSRAVGGAVVRSRVKRQLRHSVRPLLTALPTGSRLVVRALPSAATASPGRLSADVSTAVARLLAAPPPGTRR